MARAIMIQGAGSNVGKSLIVAGLARAFARRGLRVAPFKPQNMSNNAAVTADGGEIGRAQALQARAAGRAPICDMNPILLKPESETGAQVVVQGHRVATLKARDYAARKGDWLPAVLQSFGRLAATADLVLVEGAGSPAETNLRAGDIANMGFAEAANIPVVLLGDIDRGGVIAQCVGTHAVLSDADRERVKSFAINKFRGDPDLFSDGMTDIATRTGWAPLGVIPWFDGAWRLPAEDALDIRSGPRGGGIKIAVPVLSRIANFDDLDPLSSEPGVEVTMVRAGQALPGDADVVLIPGTKATLADLAYIRAQGWDIDVKSHVRRGGQVIGICGGYQILGRQVNDPEGLEGPASSHEGLGLLDVSTDLRPAKRLALSQAQHRASGEPLEGYEIHLGVTDGPDRSRGWLEVDGRIEGAASPDGRVRGTYLHGLFAADGFRRAFLAELGAPHSGMAWDDTVESALDDLAEHVEAHLDLDAVLALATEV
ncbi:cobyric acid synthase [Mesobaculum littorinae]|uniref:Cobyric acid synthase n=1 Tax=Mesobaculum littorinae TaxID=2486419 RepID=A0A438AM38_9RHOB|nr:cobyric acid synthase [Mesobaculum littorinae]RVV99901.1 cobyric acid synthase [Mesobaculum littorinae]